ncbi:NACHT domain-containing protein [Leptothoe sp. PORK10 BA2]|nr:NACHT domain-containing protein [Leptothoe sp. PORK10 BA2]
MPSIPRDYLEKLADQKGLNAFAKAAFVERLVDRDRTDMKVAMELNIARSLYSNRMTTVYKVFGLGEGRGPGKAKELFYKVLDMYEMAHPNSAIANTRVKDAVDALAEDTQNQISGWIKKKCGYMQILDMTQPIEVQEIFTQVKITDKILSKIQMEMPDVIESIKDRKGQKNKQLSLLPDTKIDGVNVLNISNKLLILGKPGAGKTTFLKHIAVLANSSKLLPGHVPVFVSLKDFQNNHKNLTLREYIEEELIKYEVTKDDLDRLLLHSRIIFLLDGLDEIRQKEVDKVTQKIKELLDSDIQNNRFLITCRVAANKYTFEGFTEAEICDFSDEQIRQFSKNWFQAHKKIDEEAALVNQKIEKFFNRINEEEGIRELASNPLLLTLLCITFLNSGDLPHSRYELYEQGVLVLLQKWDESRNVERPEVYKGLSKKRKEDLLSKIALETFERDEGLFKKRLVESIIKDYIQNLPKFISHPEEIDIDAAAVLNAIIVQHGIIMEVTRGIYAFSHRTFHEYFVANSITNSSNLEERDLHLKMVINNIHDHRWREVFLMSVSIPREADKLLLAAKAKIDFIVKDHQEIELFMSWLRDKVFSNQEFISSSELKSSAQIVYFELVVMNQLSKLYKQHSDLELDCMLMKILDHSIWLQKNVNFIPSLSQKIKIDERTSEIENSHNILIRNMGICIQKIQLVGLKQGISMLRNQLIDSKIPVIEWWDKNGYEWIKKLREISIMHRNIGKEWSLNGDTKTILKDYYNASTLIHDCLKSDCYLTREVREKLEKNYLLPMDESIT